MNLSHPTIGFKDTGHKKAKMSWISFHARKLIGVLKTIQKKMFLEKNNFKSHLPSKALHFTMNVNYCFSNGQTIMSVILIVLGSCIELVQIYILKYFCEKI